MRLLLIRARLASVALLIGLAGLGHAEAEPPANRREFAAAMAKVETGTPKETIVRLLGKPDDVRTGKDLFGIEYPHLKEFWCWGTDGHLSFPTLGRIGVDSEGNAVRICIWNKRGVPPDPELIAEDELRRLLPLIDRLPGLLGGEYNPLRMIQLVNALQPLGKQKALAVIDEYLRVADADDSGVHGVFLLLRVLFDVPEDPGFMPDMCLGSVWFLKPRTNDKAMPRFPIFLQDDIPFLLAGYGSLDGLILPPLNDVEYFRRVGKIRSRPLTPPDNPVSVVEMVVKSTQSIFTEKARDAYYDMPRTDVMNQLLWLLDSVYRKELNFDEGPNASPKKIRDKVVREILADLSKLAIRWDGKRNCYVRTDGSRFSEEPRTPGPEYWRDERKF